MDKLGIRVPNGFAITTNFYNKFMSDNDIFKLVNKLDSLNDQHQIGKVASQIRNIILESNFDSNFISELKLSY
jgi:phosphoenolpyruvate synthase/pyruvate phosphate dikinase